MVPSAVADRSAPSAEEPRYALDVRGLVKVFGTNRVLNDVDFSVASGTIHGLIGLNGSGKSTMVKILSGLYPPTAYAGCAVWGIPVGLPLSRPAENGMYFVQQEIGLAEDMTVIENVLVGRRAADGGGVDLRPLRLTGERDRYLTILGQMGWTDPDPDTRVSSLSAAEKALVAIVRAFATSGIEGDEKGSKLLILDEPTARLSEAEARRLFSVLRQFKGQGNAVILISHYLDEVLEHCDEVTVLRDGAAVANMRTRELTQERLEELMTGRELQRTRERIGHAAVVDTSERLRLSNVSCGRAVDISFGIRPGEIVACTGLVGCGMEELPYAISGLRPYTGRISVDRRPLKLRSPVHAIASGIGIAPDDRARAAVWLAGSARENVVAPLRPGARNWLRALAPRRKRVDSRRTSRVLERYHVNTRNVAAPMRELSGGNQQKIVVGRLLEREDLKVLVLHEPTSGIDVDARKALYEIIRDRVDTEGIAVLLCSTDFEEVAILADRTLVMHKGATVVELGRSTAEEIGSAASGGHSHNPSGQGAAHKGENA
jgi:ribose transport system ATP-binding protein